VTRQVKRGSVEERGVADKEKKQDKERIKLNEMQFSSL
jgi:hypothetical protein